MVEKKEANDEHQNGANDSEQAPQPPQASPEATPGQTPAGDPMDTSGQEDEKKKKKSNKIVDLPIVARTHGYSQAEFDKYFELEGKMISNDRQEKERVDARNALEEYVYDVRGKLHEGGNLFEYIDEPNRNQICNQLDDIENWLYEDGESCEREVYKTRLNDLHQKTDPIKNRHDEYQGQQQAFNDLGHAIQMSYKAVEQYRNGDPKYDHLTETEMLNITEQAEKTQRWYEDARGKLTNIKKTQDPPVKISDVRHEYNTLTTCVNSVLNRPKPRVATPPPPTKTEAPQNGSQEQPGEGKKEQNHEKGAEVEMDVE